MKGKEKSDQDIINALNEYIFRPIEGKNIHDMEDNKEYRKRFHIIHRVIKNSLIYPVLFFIEKRIGKYLVRKIDDIPEKWFNNHIRMFYHSFNKGLFDMWIYKYRGLKSKRTGKTDGEYLNDFIFKKRNLSHWSRSMLINIWCTEVMEDTIDREWFNMSIMNLAHRMMEHYGVSKKERDKVPKPGQFPVYKSMTASNPQYFINNTNEKTWRVKK